MASSSLKKVKVTCSEGEVLEIDEALVNESQTLKRLIEEKRNKGQNEISLPDISRKTLSKIDEYVKKHVDARMSTKCLERSLHDWDAEFIKVDLETIFDLLLAAQYLKIENLLNLLTEHVAGIIRGKTAEEIRQTFNIKNDFTPEEEEENRRRDMWLSHFFP